ncbi:MAG: D-alanyl-D-alanine carboxypeptidase family protein [Lachnospiraceae bacterium]
MKCTNKKKGLCIGLAIMLFLPLLSGCGQASFAFPYNAEYGVSSFQVVRTVNASQAIPFAQDLCIAVGDITEGTEVDTSGSGAALLCDVNNAEVIYASNVHERMHPASLTKIMTALVALKYGSMDQVLTATSSVNITESGAQLCGLKSGDTMTLAQALHILLIYSANDAAMLIAEGVGGSVEGFVELMNEEALALGATNTHFENPHGLTADNHYSTAYDLYLIFNEAIKYETFREIIHMTSYSTVYYNGEGEAKELNIKTTNQYFKGNFTPPDNITVVGGKTGTTNAAGHCLILLTRDTAGAPYIAVILRATALDVLYPEMTDLLSEIGK